MKNFFKCLADLVNLQALPKEQRKIVFYSEGASYWPHLEGLLTEFLKITNFPVCYISSDTNEPCFQIQHPKLKCFLTNKGKIRDWLFENIDADVMVMTMPDLNQFQVKKSKRPVHYVYVHHSLVSSHMIYREHAFDAYDTIFCAGPHHIEEMRKIQTMFNLGEKNLVPHGYGRLDSIIANSKPRPKNEIPRVLVAPSWGPNALIENVGEQVVHQLLEGGHFVKLRPHPQTFHFSRKTLDQIIHKFEDNERFSLEEGVSGQDSLHEADIMVSDWSGAALDFAFGLDKPVLFVDVPRKINNPNYDQVKIEPVEVGIRREIGEVLPLDQISEITIYVDRLLSTQYGIERFAEIRNKHVFNLGETSVVGAYALKEILTNVTGLENKR